MGIKNIIGKLLPIAAAGLGILFPAFAPIIVGTAGLVGAYLASDGFSMGDWGSQAKDADLIQANFKSTQKTIPILYGRRRVGSNDIFMEMSGEGENRVMWIVSCLAEGECDSIAIDPSTGDELVLIDNQTVAEFNHKHGENNGVDDIVKYYFHTGSAIQTVDPNISAAIPKFTDAIRNVCYIVWEIKWVKGLFSGMPIRQVVLNGRKIKDVRTDLSVFSDNPALQLYDFLTNSRFGLNFSTSMLDVDSFKAAATYCEGGVAHPAWKVNYAVASQIRSQTVIDTLLAHFRGMLTWYDGKLYLRYAQLNEEQVVGSINDSDIARDDRGYDLVTVNQPSSFMMPDAALVKYISENKNWTIDDVYIGDKLGNVVQYEFPGFTDKNLAMSMGVYMLERSQLNRTYSMTLRASNIVYEPNDILNISSSEAGLDSVTCRVIQSDISQDGLMNISFAVESQSLYNKVYDTAPDEVYRINVADPSEAPPPVSGITFQEQIYDYRERSFVRLNVGFDIPTKTLEGEDYPWFDYAEVYVSYDGLEFEFLFNAPNDFQIDPITEGAMWVALVSVSTYGQKQAFDMAARSFHHVKGVSEIAPISENYFTLTLNDREVVIHAPLRKDPDIEGWEVRLGTIFYSNTWSDASLLSVTSNPTIRVSPLKVTTETKKLTVFLDVKGKNGLYSGNPLSREIHIEYPPAGYTPYDEGVYLSTIEISFTTGSHYGTEAYDIGGGEIVLQVDRGTNENMSGYYITEEYDIETSACLYDIPILFSVEMGTALRGGGNTWDDVAPGSGVTWNDIYTLGETRNWLEIGGKTQEASKIAVQLEVNRGGEWQIYQGLENYTVTALCTKYVRFVFRIEDVQLSSHYMAADARFRRFVPVPRYVPPPP